MSLRIAALFLLVAVGQAHATDLDRVYIMGIGRVSCASWLDTASSEAQGSAWLLGFWTGANVRNDTGVVGSSTDAVGVIATIKKRCQDAPADSLVSVVAKTFNEFATAGK